MPSGAAPRDVRPGVTALGAALDAVPAGVAVLRGPNFVFELANSACRAMASDREMLGRRFADVFPGAAKQVVPVLERVLATGKPFRQPDLRVSQRRGAVREDAWFTVEYRRVGDEGDRGVLVHIVETSEWVRARLRANETAQSASERLGALLTGDPGGLAVFAGPELRIELANAAFRRCAAEPDQDPVGRTAEQVWPDDDGLRVRALLERASRGDAVRGERIERVVGGRTRSLVLHATALPARPEREVLLSLWDATELDAARRDVERARERAELLAAMAAELSAGEDLETVVDTALARGTALVGAEDGALFLLEPDGRHLRGFREVWARERPGALLDLEHLPASRKAVGRRAPVLYRRPDAEEDEILWFDRIGAWATIAAPLVVDAACIGVLYLNYRRPEDEPGRDDIDFSAAIASHCALAILRAQSHDAERLARERAQAAEAKARKAAERLALVADVTAAITAVQGVDDVAEAIFERGLRPFGARVAVLQLRDGTGGLVLVHEFGERVDRSRWRRIPAAFQVPTSEALRRGQPVWVEGSDALLAMNPALADAPWVRGFGAWVGLPLQVETRTIGVVGLSFEEGRRIDPEERAIICSLAQKFAQAIDRARAQEEHRAQVTLAERARARAVLLADVATELNRQVDAASVLRTALAGVAELLGGGDGSVFLLEDQGQALRGLVEVLDRGRAGVVARLADLPHTAQAIAERRPLWLPRSDASGSEREWIERGGVGGSLLLPMFQDGACVGVMYVDQDVQAPPPPEDLAFGEAIAGQCAVALARARTFEAERAARSRAEVAEAAARRIAQRLAVSQELTAALSSAYKEEDVALAIFEHGLRPFGASAASLLAPVGDRLVLKASSGYPEDRLARLREGVAVAARSPIAEAFRSGHPVFSGHPVSVESLDALAALPLVSDGRVLAVLGFAFGEPREFDLEERAFMGSLAAKCAQALERARLHQAERTARAEAERVGKLQEQLLAVVGHDLRTPLSAIVMGTSGLLRRGALDEKQAQTLTRIAASAQRMAGIIRDLLDFSRARQGGGIPITRGPTDLREIAARAILELLATHPQREIRLRGSGDTTVHGDEARLLQVASNLVGNAIQHGPADARIEVAVEGEGDELRLGVHNEGTPIPAEVLPSLFEPFRRGDGGPGEAGSVGLGLYIVREIVRAHGGSVEIRSSAGEGTIATVRLPRG